MTDILFATFLNMVKEPHIQNTHTHLESPIQRSLNSHTLGWKGTPGPCVGWLWLQMLKGGGNASNVLVNVMSDLNCVLAIGLYVWGRYTQLPYHQLITSLYLPSRSIVHKDDITFTNASIALSLWGHAFNGYSCPLSATLLCYVSHIVQVISSCLIPFVILPPQ